MRASEASSKNNVDVAGVHSAAKNTSNRGTRLNRPNESEPKQTQKGVGGATVKDRLEDVNAVEGPRKRQKAFNKEMI